MNTLPSLMPQMNTFKGVHRINDGLINGWMCARMDDWENV